MHLFRRRRPRACRSALRHGRGDRSIPADRRRRGTWLRLRVLDTGTSSRPSFDRPTEVVRWWVGAVAHAALVAVKSWPRSAFRDRDGARWRLLDPSVTA